MLAVLLLMMAAAGTAAAPPLLQGSSGQTSQAAPAARSPLTLEEAIARARATSPLREAAQRRLDATATAGGLVRGLPNPLIELRRENWGASTQPINPRDTFVTVTQVVELGGKSGARRRDASAAVDVARADVLAADRALSVSVAEHYVAAARARESRAVYIAQRESLTEIVRILSERVREGTGAEADLRRFETETTRVDLAIARVSIALDQELSTLSLLLGAIVVPEQLVIPAVPEVAPAAPAISETDVARRPDVRAAAARVQQLDAAAATERAAATPDLTVSGGYKGTNNFTTGVAAVSLAVPIFDRNQAAIARAAGEAQAARLDAAYLQQQAIAEATARWGATRELLTHAAAVETTLVSPAAVVRTAARAAFVEGGGDLLRLVDAERAYLDATRDALDLRLDAVLSLIHARLSSGEDLLP